MLFRSAARAAVSSPLLEVSMDGARGVLYNITGGPDMTMNEVDEAAKIISDAADPDANIIFGTAIDEALHDQVKITVIATGFDQTRSKLREFLPSNQSPINNLQQSPIQKEEKIIEEPKGEKTEEEVWDIPAFLRHKN